jgi:hypothetical protein
VWLITTNWQLGIMAACGVVLLVFFYHDTRHWRSLKGVVMTLFLGLGILFGILLGLFVIWPIVLVVYYWVPSKPDVVFVAAEIVALVVGLAFVGRIVLKVPGVEMLRFFSRSLRVVPAGCFIGMAVATVTSFTILAYPPDVGRLIEPAWSNFRLGAMVLFIPIGTAYVIHRIIESQLRELTPSLRTLPPLTRKRRKPTAYALARKAMGRRDVRTFLKALVLILLIAFMIVPLDKTFVLFVPKVSTGSEKPFASEGCPTIGHLTLVRLLNGTIRFYQIMQLNYTVRMPFVRHLVDRLYIPNPSNFSAIFQNPMWSADDVGMLWMDSSSGISAIPQGHPGSVTALLANLTMVSGPNANFTVLYSQEFLRRNIIVDVTPRRVDEANHSYEYSFSFKDNEDLCVAISRIELPELRSGEVNGTLVRAFLEGGALPGFFVDPDGIRFYGLYVYSGRAMNVTLVLPMKGT